LSEPRLKNLLRYFLAAHDILMPSHQQLQQICQQLNAEADKSPVVQLAECCIRRYKGELYLTNVFQDIVSWQKSTKSDFLTDNSSINISLPDELGHLNFSAFSGGVKSNRGMYLKKPKINQMITVSFKHENPKCLPQYRQHSRSLKKVLQELTIPPWQRKRLPFIFYDNELVAVVGQFICKDYVADNESEAFAISWKGESSF